MPIFVMFLERSNFVVIETERLPLKLVGAGPCSWIFQCHITQQLIMRESSCDSIMLKYLRCLWPVNNLD